MVEIKKEIITRSLIYKKRYKTAYKIASEHSLSSGPSFAKGKSGYLVG